MLTEKILLLLRFLYFYTTPPAYPSLFREAIKKHRLYFILFICLMSATCMGQTYNMSNTTINTCSGTFFDSGGAANYSNNQLITMTFFLWSFKISTIVVNKVLFPTPGIPTMRIFLFSTKYSTQPWHNNFYLFSN